MAVKFTPASFDTFIEYSTINSPFAGIVSPFGNSIFIAFISSLYSSIQSPFPIIAEPSELCLIGFNEVLYNILALLTLLSPTLIIILFSISSVLNLEFLLLSNNEFLSPIIGNKSYNILGSILSSVLFFIINLKFTISPWFTFTISSL